jgi:hypothetical protein
VKISRLDQTPANGRSQGACNAATLGAAAYALMRDGFAKIMVANSANGRSPLNRRAWRLADFTLAAPSYGRVCETTCAPPRLQTAMLGSFIQSRHAPPWSLQPASQTPLTIPALV